MSVSRWPRGQQHQRLLRVESHLHPIKHSYCECLIRCLLAELLHWIHVLETPCWYPQVFLFGFDSLIYRFSSKTFLLVPVVQSSGHFCTWPFHGSNAKWYRSVSTVFLMQITEGFTCAASHKSTSNCITPCNKNRRGNSRKECDGGLNEWTAI